MTITRRIVQHAVALMLLMVSRSAAFVPTSYLSRKNTITGRFASPELLPDPTDLLNALESTSRLIADAAAAVADADKPDGWWETYISLFKGTLSFVHNTIDPPLRSLGIEQTWGISIAIFTLMIRSCLLPLSVQQSKSAEYMKALKPYVSEIKEKMKDNQDAQNRAIGKLYEDAKQNPLAGCATSLAQLPIFLGLYRGVSYLAKEDQLREPFLFIPSLEGPVSPPNYNGLDWLIKGWTSSPDGFPVPSLGWETTLAFLIMPITLVILQSITMSTLQPPIDDSMGEEEKKTVEQSQAIFKFLPLMVGFFSIQVPAGLTIYWFTSNLFTLSQTLAVKAYFKANPPKIELPEYWETALDKGKDFASMTPEERRQAVEAGIRVGPTMEDLVDEARFHTFIDRYSFRADTEAWDRVVKENKLVIPPELQEWVEAGSNVEAASRPGPKAIIGSVAKVASKVGRFAMDRVKGGPQVIELEVNGSLDDEHAEEHATPNDNDKTLAVPADSRPYFVE